MAEKKKRKKKAGKADIRKTGFLIKGEAKNPYSDLFKDLWRPSMVTSSQGKKPSFLYLRRPIAGCLKRERFSRTI